MKKFLQVALVFLISLLVFGLVLTAEGILLTYGVVAIVGHKVELLPMMALALFINLVLSGQKGK